MQIIIAFSVLLFLAVPASSQPSHNPFILSEPLPSSYVTDIVQDEKGFIWVATRNGLCRYDGTSLLTLQHDQHHSESLSHNDVTDLLYDQRRNRLFVASEGGLSILDPQTLSFTHLRVKDYASNKKNTEIRSLSLDPEGRLWFSIAETGIAYYAIEDDSLFCFPIEGDWPDPFLPHRLREVLDIASDPFDPNMLWLSTPGGFVRFEIEQGRFIPYFITSESPATQFSFNQVRNILPRKDSSLWIGTWSKGLIQLFPDRTAIPYALIDQENYNHYPLLGNAPPLLPVDAEKVWYNGSSSCLLDLSTLQLSECIHMQTARGIDYLIQIRLVDSKDRKWASSEYGLHLFDPLAQQFKNYHFEADDGFYYVHARFIELPDNRCVIGYEHSPGIFLFDEKIGATVQIDPLNRDISSDDPMHYVGFVQPKNGVIWVVDRHRFYELDLILGKLIPIKLPIDQLGYLWSSVIQARDGSLWIGTKSSGLIHFQPASGEVRAFPAELIPGENGYSIPINHLFEDGNGNIWAAKDFGYSVYSKAQDTILHFQSPEGEDPRPGNFIEDAQGRIWAASDGIGLLQFSPQDPGHGVIDILDRKDGLQTLSIKSIALDERGHIWMITEDGIQEFDPQLSTSVIYNGKDGMVMYDHRFNRNPSLLGMIGLLSDGRMAYAPRAGFAIFDPQKMRLNHERPVPYFRKIIVSDSLLFKDVFGPIDLKRLPFKKNNLEIQCSAIAYTHPDKSLFQYKLNNEEWKNMDNRSVHFSNLAAGDYHFFYRVVNSSGASSEVLDWKFRIQVPWYKSWWFILAVVSMSIIIVRAFMLWSDRRKALVREKEREVQILLAGLESRALRNQMNPHFLFNIFNNIQELILTGDTEKAYTYTTKFSKLLRMILEYARKDEITIDQEVVFLSLYLELESLRFDDQFDYQIKVEDDARMMNFPAFIIQPLVENAIRHGLLPKEGEKLLNITFRANEDHITCIVMDNGIGFDKHEINKVEKDRDHALQLIRNRLGLLKGGKLVVENRKDSIGTIARVYIPYSQQNSPTRKINMTP